MQYYSEDGSMGPDCAVARWIGLSIKAAVDRGRDPSPGPKLEGWVRDVGFKDVVHQRLKLPIGRWPKDETLVGCSARHPECHSVADNASNRKGLERGTCCRFSRDWKAFPWHFSRAFLAGRLKKSKCSWRKFERT